MLKRILTLCLVLIAATAGAQQSPTGAALPSPEEFVNSIDTTVIPKKVKHYFLVVGTDSCRFLKYNYDDWIQYHLKEPLAINVLNELSEKVYLSRYPYLWKQRKLNKAVCVTQRQADSLLRDHRNVLFSFSLPQFTDDGQYAVIDLNFVCGPVCGQGTTYIFRLTTEGEWKLVGQYVNWVS
ncbi:MAG TPA: hypothetical protein VGM89_09115 [Puia sp.]|jgi:hypothetical protein